ncbi:MAG: asparagine synthase-related protein [Candidatus Sulfotelmatobacter sp.]|jgi:asparagine synthase (glutamine-hydrolysing)
MSVIFGRWNFDGKSPTPQYLHDVRAILSPYAPDGGHSYSSNDISILYHAFHTTRDSRQEAQPLVTQSGLVVTWDGRLDNRQELIHECNEMLPKDPPDVLIVAAAYELWGTKCLAKITGDWALSVWSPDDRSLVLAKDIVGTRPLFYSIEKSEITWSTILDPLVLYADKSFVLDEEYVAGWLSSFPAPHLTPYVGIHSVPPSSFVHLQNGKQIVRQYWDFDPAKRIRYRTDAEYEEHFRVVFAESLRRRLRSDSPILAELSGGMDSSSIVCMADTVIDRGAADTPRLDTLSYYNDSEPNWNERPYFTKVEEKRGRTGHHIDIGLDESSACGIEIEDDRFMAAPGSYGRHAPKSAREYVVWLASSGYRVVLSGIGGDEVTGGVPSPAPELGDLLTRARIPDFAHQLKVWALTKRRPWFHLLFEAVRPFFSPSLFRSPVQRRPAPWLEPSFIRRNYPALTGYQSRLKVFGPLPTFQENLNALNSLRRQMGCSALSCEPPYDMRYPFLDRDLLKFLYAVPREQILRPGQRRSLLRRALAGVVPDEILNRKRKAYVVRSALAAVSSGWESLAATNQEMISSVLEIVDQAGVLEALKDARRGYEVPVVLLLRTIAIEAWLRALESRRQLYSHPQTTTQNSSRLDARLMSHPVRQKKLS